ncbi:hypothetical protein Tco_0175544 [Tanacetum coccineum]
MKSHITPNQKRQLAGQSPKEGTGANTLEAHHQSPASSEDSSKTDLLHLGSGGKIAINPNYLDKTLVLKNSFPVAWRILFIFVIQVLGGNYSSTEQVNSIQQLLSYCLITWTEVDIGEIIYSDLVTKLLNKSRLKYVSYPIFISCALQVLLGSDYTQDENFGFLPPIPSNSLQNWQNIPLDYELLHV